MEFEPDEKTYEGVPLRNLPGYLGAVLRIKRLLKSLVWTKTMRIGPLFPWIAVRIL